MAIQNIKFTHKILSRDVKSLGIRDRSEEDIVSMLEDLRARHEYEAEAMIQHLIFEIFDLKKATVSTPTLDLTSRGGSRRGDE